MSDEKKVNRAKAALVRLYRIADKYVIGNKAGAILLGAMIGLAAPSLGPAAIASLAETANQVLDALSEDPA